MSNIYYCEKLMFSKTCWECKFLGKKILRKCASFEEQKGARYIQGNIYFGIIVFSCLSSTKLCLRSPLICFAQEIKGFYQSFIGNEVDFFFSQGFLLQTLTIHRTAGEGRGPSFVPFHHVHLLTNIETFICNFACEMTIMYF